jgi:hypothetical protein
VQLFQSTVTGQSHGGETALVKVPANFKILCGGASLDQDDKQNQFLTQSNVIDTSQCSADAQSVHINTMAALTAYVYAVYDPEDLLDICVSEQSTSVAACSQNLATQLAPGHVLTGGGVTTTQDERADCFLLTASYPQMVKATQNNESDSNNAYQWVAKAQQHSKVSYANITVKAIGIKWKEPIGKPTLKIQILTNSSTRGTNPSACVGVDSDFTLVGGGALDDYSSQGNLLQNSYPQITDKAKVWTASGHDCKYTDVAILKVYAPKHG